MYDCTDAELREIKKTKDAKRVKFAAKIVSSKVCMLASATLKQKRITAKSKLSMQKHGAQTEQILARAAPEVMQLDAVSLRNEMIFF